MHTKKCVKAVIVKVILLCYSISLQSSFPRSWEALSLVTQQQELLGSTLIGYYQGSQGIVYIGLTAARLCSNGSKHKIIIMC